MIESTTSSPSIQSLEALQSTLQRHPTRSQIAKDTIEPAASKKPVFTPSKPRLSPEMRVINASDQLYRAGEKQLLVHSGELESEQRHIEELCRANITKMKEAAERSQQAGVWSYLQKIGSGILSAISIFLGVSLVTSTTAVFVGGALIGAGIMTLANLVLTEAEFWDWVAEKIAHDNDDLKKKIREWTPLIIGLLANGVQFLALGALSIFGTLDLASQSLLIAQMVSNVATTVAAVGGQISEARVAWSEAEVTELQGKLALSQHEVEYLTDHIEEALNRQQQTHRSAKHILDLAIEARRQAIYSV